MKTIEDVRKFCQDTKSGLEYAKIREDTFIEGYHWAMKNILNFIDSEGEADANKS